MHDDDDDDDSFALFAVNDTKNGILMRISFWTFFFEHFIMTDQVVDKKHAKQKAAMKEYIEKHGGGDDHH